MQDFIVYHGLQGRRPRGFTFQGLHTHPEGIHVGSLAQARMRAGGGTILKLRLRSSAITRIPRVRDQSGYWKNLLRRRARQGDRILTYLNRYEGIPTDRVIKTLGRDLDCARMTDAAFRKLVPEAQDSWIVLDPALIEILGSVRKPRARSTAI